MSFERTDPTHKRASLEAVSQDGRVESAILRAVAYADIFDYPLTAREIHHYLVKVPASPGAVQAALDNGRLVSHRLSQSQGYFTLPGREEIIPIRRWRKEIAARMWPSAMRYGRIMGDLPFVRLVALTGALTVDNVEPDADIDYLIVTERGRLWLCRALVILLVKLAARRGDVICPNYFLSEDALALQEQNLFTAHELVQMIPIVGLKVYRRMRRLNTWAQTFLPNANGPLRRAAVPPSQFGSVRAVAETVLRTPVGSWLEQWELNRKVPRFSQQDNERGEAAFCADWCKGHFDYHGQRTLKAYAERLQTLEVGLRET